MLFKTRFHEGLRQGSITQSFRAWKTRKVSRGGQYRFTATDAIEVDDIVSRLERMDRLSRRGPWTASVLALIGDKPRTAASKLAPLLDRETQPFKTDVRKLKKLGLTRSFEVGYELTTLGAACLARYKEVA